MEKSTNGRYYMILGRDLMNVLGMGRNCSENVIHGGEGPYKGCSAPMVDVNNYGFNILMSKTVKPKEYFINAYVSECFEYESAISATLRIRRISDAKYEKADLNKFMTKQFQHLNTE